MNAVGSVLGVVLGTFVARGALRHARRSAAARLAPGARGALGASRVARQGVARAALAGPSCRRWPPAACSRRPAASTRTCSRSGSAASSGSRRGCPRAVAVCEHPDGSRWIQFSDGRGASGTWSFQGGWLYAHLPLLLHPGPRSAAVICFGTGNTLGAASLHPLQALDGIELSPEVVKAASLFAATNHDVVASGRARIVIEDAPRLHAGDGPALRRDQRGAAARPHRGRRQPLLAGFLRAVLAPSRRRRDAGRLARDLGAGDARDAHARARLRRRLPQRDGLGLAPIPASGCSSGSKQPLRIDLDALAAGWPTPRSPRPRPDRRRARRDPHAGRSALPLPDGARGARGLRGRRAAGHRRPVGRRLHDTAPRTRQFRPRASGSPVASRSPAVGERGLQSELLLREFDRIYAFRERWRDHRELRRARPRSGFAAEVREKMRAREMKAAGTIGGLRTVAADLRAMGQPPRSLESLERGLALVPPEACGPLHEMRAQLLRGDGSAGGGPGGSRSRRGGAMSRKKRKRQGIAFPAPRAPPRVRAACGVSPLAVPRRARGVALRPAAAARAGAAGMATASRWTSCATGRGGRAALPQQPALHLALLRQGRRPRRTALLPRGPQAEEHRAGLRARQLRRPGRSRAGFRHRAHARGAAARPVSGRGVRGHATPPPPRSTRTTSSDGPRQLLLEPDLFVVYAGNNEVVGTYGAGTVLTRRPRRSRSCAPRSWSQDAGRPARLERNTDGGGARGRGRPPGAWRGMEMFLDRRWAERPRARAGLPALRGNLADTCRVARTAGVPVVLEHPRREPAQLRAVRLPACGHAQPAGAGRLGASSSTRA